MSKFVTLTIKDWHELNRLAVALPAFIFRGQANAAWPLCTSLERCFDNFSPLIKLYENKEFWILHEFKRKYHLYANNPPKQDSNFEWLAVLQHHGCPSRLLDFTNSLYVAAFFAVADATADSVIWAVNYQTLRENIKAKFDLKYQFGYTLADEINRCHISVADTFIANQTLNQDAPRFVVYLEPLIFTQRLSAQQGLFLMPTNLRVPFMENLVCSFANDSTDAGEFEPVTLEQLQMDPYSAYENSTMDIIKIIIPRELHDFGIRDLSRMNITSETLFPGLDGFVRSFVQTVIRD